MRAAKKILRYLAGCPNYALRYNCTHVTVASEPAAASSSSSSSNSSSSNEGAGQRPYASRVISEIVAYCDADWGGDRADRKSTTGYCVYLDGALVSWNVKKQATVALSTAEAELMAIVEVVKEVSWLSQFLDELGVCVRKPISIRSDNQAAIKMAQHDIEHDRTKHIDIKYCFIRDEIAKGQVVVSWVRTERQIADVFTKTLLFPAFSQHRAKLLSPLSVTSDSTP
jgi:hypothetical protein